MVERVGKVEFNGIEEVNVDVKVMIEKGKMGM